MTEKTMHVWESMQYIVLALTIAGQVAIGANYYVGQSMWLISNIITVTRNIVLARPKADKVQGWAMAALTFGLILANLIMGR